MNAFYDLPKWAVVSPYVGFGVGYHVASRTSGDVQRDYTVTSGSTTNTGSQTVHEVVSQTDQGLYLAEVGLNVPLGRSLTLVPGYRYSQTFSGKVPLNTFKMGLRYSF